MIAEQNYSIKPRRPAIRTRPNYFYLNQLKSEMKLRVMKNHWRDCGGIQLKLFFDENEKGLKPIFKLKSHFLLLDVYDFIFREGHSYQDVHLVLLEILTELKLIDEFKPWINDPGSMMLHAFNEYNHLEQDQIA